MNRRRLLEQATGTALSLDPPFRRNAAVAVGRAIDELRRGNPDSGSYVSESDYFERGWQRSFCGANYPRLIAAKAKYDPDDLFIVHHGVGGEHWSPDGFTRLD